VLQSRFDKVFGRIVVGGLVCGLTSIFILFAYMAIRDAGAWLLVLIPVAFLFYIIGTIVNHIENRGDDE
jgi:ABC-type multidrug transport system permease subunit